jgi:Fe-S oxidoreductase
MVKNEQSPGIDECTLCGMCREVCPIFKVNKSEAASPRGKAIFRKKGLNDEIFFQCTLCGACKQACPSKVDLGLKAHRAALVNAGKDAPGSRKMIENVRKYGNPFGEGKDEPEDLYCC